MKQIVLLASVAFLESFLGISADQRTQIVERIKADVRNELLAIGFKLIAGSALASLFVYAVIQFSEAFQNFTKQIENGYVLDLITFACLALVSIAAFISIFYRNVRSIAGKRLKSEHQNSDIDLRILISSFAEGLAKGLESPEKTSSEVSPPMSSLNKAEFN